MWKSCRLAIASFLHAMLTSDQVGNFLRDQESNWLEGALLVVSSIAVSLEVHIILIWSRLSMLLSPSLPSIIRTRMSPRRTALRNQCSRMLHFPWTCTSNCWQRCRLHKANSFPDSARGMDMNFQFILLQAIARQLAAQGVLTRHRGASRVYRGGAVMGGESSLASKSQL